MPPLKLIITLCLNLMCLCCMGQIDKTDTSAWPPGSTPPPAPLEFDKPQIELINAFFDKKFGNVDYHEIDQIPTGFSTLYADISKTDPSDTILKTRVDLPMWGTEDLDGAVPILYGDLNQDHIPDMVVSVTARGNGKGDSTVTQYLFTFLQVKGQFQILSVISDQMLSGCPPHQGHFRATSIKNGILYGKATCSPLQGARCCQDPYYDAEVQLAGDKLELKKKTPHKP